MPLLRSINEYGIHLPMDVEIHKGPSNAPVTGRMTVLDPDDNEKGSILAIDSSVTITNELDPIFEEEE